MASDGWITHKWLAVTILALSSTALGAPDNAPVDPAIVQWNATFSSSQPVHAGEKTTLLLSGAIPDGWHVYSLTQPPGGPIALKVSLDDADTGSIIGDIKAPSPLTKQDRAFDLETQTYSGALQLAVPVSLRDGLTQGAHDVRVSVRYQSCSERECRPPRTVHLTARIDVAAAH